MYIGGVKGWEQSCVGHQQTQPLMSTDTVLGGTSPTFNGSKGSLLVLLPCDVFVLILVMVAPLSVYIIVDISGERGLNSIMGFFSLGDFLVLV